MKKIVALLLAAMLCIGCTAFAEEIVLTGKPTVPALSKPEYAMGEEAMAASTDVVVTTDTTVTVTASGIKIHFDIAATGSAYITLTQDFYASFAGYRRFKDPQAMMEGYILANDIKLWACDEYTDDQYVVLIGEADSDSQMIGDLCNLNETNVNYVASAWGAEAGFFNGRPWLMAPQEGIYLTIVNGQYVQVYVFAGVDGTYVPVDEVSYFLSALTLTAAQ